LARTRREASTIVALDPGEVHHVNGVIALSTNRERDGEAVAGTLGLDACEGVVLELA